MEQPLKKTVTLTDDQIVPVGVAIYMQIANLNELLKAAQERGEKSLIHLYEKDIAALEQAKAAIKEAKWEF